jgi:hypothetical protein
MTSSADGAAADYLGDSLRAHNLWVRRHRRASSSPLMTRPLSLLVLADLTGASRCRGGRAPSVQSRQAWGGSGERAPQCRWKTAQLEPSTACPKSLPGSIGAPPWVRAPLDPSKRHACTPPSPFSRGRAPLGLRPMHPSYRVPSHPKHPGTHFGHAVLVSRVQSSFRCYECRGTRDTGG